MTAEPSLASQFSTLVLSSYPNVDVAFSELSNMFRRKRNNEQSASDVLKEYRSRIEEFVEHVVGKNSTALQEPGDSLDGLFRWSEKAHEDRVQLNHRYRVQSEARKEAEEQRDNLASILSERDREILKLNERTNRLVMDHSRALDEIKQSYEGKIGTMTQRHEKDIETMKQKFNNEKNRLIGQLLVNVDEAKSWPDDALKRRFKELQGLVDNMTSPVRVRLRLPEAQHIQLDFDPTGFLCRVPEEKAHLLLKSIVWSILYEHFFTLPFGFGVLGSIEQQNPLLDAFASWQTVVDGGHAPLSKTGEDFSIFRTSHVANSWRSMTFESAFSVITSGNSSHAINATAQLSSANLDVAISRIASLFNSISQYSTFKSPPSPDEMRDTAKLAREIAFQFGVNPAHLRLLIPERGQVVQIGAQYNDYKNATDAGTLVKVDLVTLPGLQKLGHDSTGQVSGVMTIVPCKIFADART